MLQTHEIESSKLKALQKGRVEGNERERERGEDAYPETRRKLFS